MCVCLCVCFFFVFLSLCIDEERMFSYKINVGQGEGKWNRKICYVYFSLLRACMCMSLNGQPCSTIWLV